MGSPSSPIQLVKGCAGVLGLQLGHAGHGVTAPEGCGAGQHHLTAQHALLSHPLLTLPLRNGRPCISAATNNIQLLGGTLTGSLSELSWADLERSEMGSISRDVINCNWLCTFVKLGVSQMLTHWAKWLTFYARIPFYPFINARPPV